jgi:hypothetical protein
LRHQLVVYQEDDDPGPLDQLLSCGPSIPAQSKTGGALYRIANDSSHEGTSLQGECGQSGAADPAPFVRLDPELQVADRVGLD